jgi:hypothetical protein
VLARLSELGEDHQAVDVGHHHVEHHDVVLVGRDLERGGAVACLKDAVALHFEDVAEELSELRRIVDDQHSRHHIPLSVADRGRDYVFGPWEPT